jgi:hypothetical protein
MTTPAIEDTTPAVPALAPGLYRRPGSDRWWSHDELVVIWYDGRWCVVPRVALAALPTGEGSDARA